MSETTLGVMIGNRGFFPDALAREGREEVLRTLEAAGYKTVCLTPEETKHGAVETLQEARKCADLFKQHSGGDRRHRGVAAQFRRRARGGQRAAHERAGGSGAGAGVSGRAEQDADGRPARQLLRQDVGVQQPVAVRHPLHADPAAHGVARLGGVQSRSRFLCGHLPDCEGAEEPARGGDRGAAGGVQHRALQREAAGARRDHGGTAGPLGSAGTHPAPGGR